MLVHVLTVIALCWGTITAAPEPREDSLNHYIDLVLDNLQVLIVENGLDPATLPNATTGFSDVVLGVTWHGEASLYDGYLKGMSSIYRTGDANFVRDSSDLVIGFSAALGLGDMQGHYKCLAKFMDLGPIADVKIDVKGVSMSFDATLDRKACRFQVSNLDVKKIGHISVDIHGLGPLNWILEIVTDLVVNVVEVFLRSMIEDTVTGYVNEALNSVDLSILAPIIGCDPTYN